MCPGQGRVKAHGLVALEWRAKVDRPTSPALRFIRGHGGRTFAHYRVTKAHPNIVTVHAIERNEGALFMAMEYLDGKTLAEVIPRGGLPLPRLLSLATQIVDALVAAHGRGVVHRDLRPGT